MGKSALIVQLQKVRENNNLGQGKHTPELLAHLKGRDGGGCSVSSLQAAKNPHWTARE